jgi:hypothetical protein
VRGFTVLYDQAMAGIMEPVVVAMSSAFLAFPAAPRAAAAPQGRICERRRGRPGHIVTSREALEGCHVVTVAGIGGADRVAEDKDNGLVLLRVHGASLKPWRSARGAEGRRDLLGDRRSAGARRRRRGQRREGARLRHARRSIRAGARLRRRRGARCAGQARRHRALKAGRGAGRAARARRRSRRSALARRAERGAGVGRRRPEAAKASVVRVICVRK